MTNQRVLYSTLVPGQVVRLLTRQGEKYIAKQKWSKVQKEVQLVGIYMSESNGGGKGPVLPFPVKDPNYKQQCIK